MRLIIEGMYGRDIVIMPAVVIAAIFGSQCSSLIRLQIAAVNVGLAGPEMAALAVLTRLRQLQVRERARGLPVCTPAL